MDQKKNDHNIIVCETYAQVVSQAYQLAKTVKSIEPFLLGTIPSRIGVYL